MKYAIFLVYCDIHNMQFFFSLHWYLMLIYALCMWQEETDSWLENAANGLMGTQVSENL